MFGLPSPRLAPPCTVTSPLDSRTPPPSLIVHADWGSDPRKRWMCAAHRVGPDSWEVGPPELVGDLPTFLPRMRRRGAGGGIFVGFDFPIGVPVAWAERAGVSHFVEVLEHFGSGDWSDVYRLAETRSQISVRRPFYPYRPGGTRRSHLVEGLGLRHNSQLLRRCERGNSNRGPASPLFWTLGGQQVGRAAIIGWREVLGPGLRNESLDLGIWPFHGSLEELLARREVVVAETYPAEACLHLGLTPPGRGWSKTRQEGRLQQAPGILAWAARRGVELDSALMALIGDGFGSASSAEDPFDALLGLLSMLEVALGKRPSGEPASRVVQEVEGWILGLEDGESSGPFDLFATAEERA